MSGRQLKTGSLMRKPGPLAIVTDAHAHTTGGGGGGGGGRGSLAPGSEHGRTGGGPSTLTGHSDVPPKLPIGPYWQTQTTWP